MGAEGRKDYGKKGWERERGWKLEERRVSKAEKREREKERERKIEENESK